jgi:hypothetical protein
MGLINAYKIWELKQENSDFKRIKINASGSFQMKSEDLFENKEEVKKYVKAIKDSLKNRQMIMNSLATRK